MLARFSAPTMSGSQLPITLAPGDRVCSLASVPTCTYMYTHTQRDTHTRAHTQCHNTTTLSFSVHWQDESHCLTKLQGRRESVILSLGHRCALDVPIRKGLGGLGHKSRGKQSLGRNAPESSRESSSVRRIKWIRGSVRSPLQL